eukprot:3750487-Amphidinium_carterae.1
MRLLSTCACWERIVALAVGGAAAVAAAVVCAAGRADGYGNRHRRPQICRHQLSSTRQIIVLTCTRRGGVLHGVGC